MNELPQLIIIIVILGVAYAAIRVWSARSKISRDTGSGPGDGGGGGAAGGGGSESVIDHSNDVVDNSQIPRSNRNKDRFNLTGRDAEVAAKVLKRMLKKDDSA